jgi:hypothetical protein
MLVHVKQKIYISALLYRLEWSDIRLCSAVQLDPTQCEYLAKGACICIVQMVLQMAWMV